MLFLEKKAPSVRLAFAAGTLIAGEVLGFALPGLADAWGWVGVWGGLALLAAYGWRVRHVGFPALLLLGVVLALRTEATLRDLLEGNEGFYGPRPVLEVPVEGEVNCCRNTKTGTWRVDFQSHLGPIPLKVVLPIPNEETIPRVGETWRVDGWISQKKGLRSRYSRRTLWVPEPTWAGRVAAARFDVARAGWTALGEELARRAGEGLSWCPELAGLNRAILLGRRNDLSRERKRAFVDAGTIHVFAISGLHVMVVAWLLQSLLARVGVSPRGCGLIGLPLVWAYVVLTGARPSAIRAATMASLMFAAPVLGRRSDSLAAWSITALGVYALSPELVFDLGCALSFTVMFGIVFWCHWSRHFRPWFAEGSRWRKWAGNLGVSFAAWVAGVPLAASAFGRFTPGGLLANLVVVTCAGWMVKLGASALAVSFVCIPLAALLNNAAAACTWGMTVVSERVAALPFSSFEVTPWPISLCGLWYLFWFLVLLALGAVLPRRASVSRRWW